MGERPANFDNGKLVDDTTTETKIVVPTPVPDTCNPKPDLRTGTYEDWDGVSTKILAGWRD